MSGIPVGPTGPAPGTARKSRMMRLLIRFMGTNARYLSQHIVPAAPPNSSRGRIGNETSAAAAPTHMETSRQIIEQQCPQLPAIEDGLIEIGRQR